jgi:hypothetical protein
MFGDFRVPQHAMTEKSAKKKTKKGAKAGSDPSVMGSLRSTRPTRLGGERRAAPRSRAAGAGASVGAKAARAGAKPAGASASVSAKSAPAGAKGAGPKTAAGPKAAAKPKVAPMSKVVPPPKAAAKPAPPPPPPPRERDGRPSGSEIVTTAVQAAGELAQIGVAVGRQLLKRAANRLPRP